MIKTDKFMKDVLFERIVERTCDCCGEKINSGDEFIRFVVKTRSDPICNTTYSLDICTIECLNKVVRTRYKDSISNVYLNGLKEKQSVFLDIYYQICDNDRERRIFNEEEE